MPSAVAMAAGESWTMRPSRWVQSPHSPPSGLVRTCTPRSGLRTATTVAAPSSAAVGGPMWRARSPLPAGLPRFVHSPLSRSRQWTSRVWSSRAGVYSGLTAKTREPATPIDGSSSGPPASSHDWPRLTRSLLPCTVSGRRALSAVVAATATE